MQEIQRSTNRHIAKLLDNLEALCPNMPPLAKTAVKQEMHFLADDVQTIASKHVKGQSNGQRVH